MDEKIPEKQNPDKQLDENSIDKKSEKSLPENEKSNDKSEMNIDTKTHDEKQKNLENLKEEIR